jgi:predicted DCC family thiol-disulfide oxidoreductase YuxK
MAKEARQARAGVLILYDGVCGLCNRFVNFVVKHDRRRVFRFASLQSPTAHNILDRHRIRTIPMDTVYVVANFGLPTERVLSKSSATLHILSQLGGAWRLAGVARAVPARLRDLVYDAIARRRYRIFGKYDTCPLPDPSHRDRFIDPVS